MPPRSDLVFGAFLAYSPHGKSAAALGSRALCRKIKEDKIHNGQPISIYTALRLRDLLSTKANVLAPLFGRDVVLVPVPRSGVRMVRENSALWPAMRIAQAIVDVGLASRVEALIVRERYVTKSATASAVNRPPPSVHFDSFSCARASIEPVRIVLVDDVITRGATMLGAAGRLDDSWPNADVSGFAIVRTMSDVDEVQVVSPCVGRISNQDDNPRRRP